MRCQRWTNS